MFKITLWEDEMLLEVGKEKSEDVQRNVNNLIVEQKLSVSIDEVSHNHPDVDCINIKGTPSDLYIVLVELKYWYDRLVLV